MNSKNYNQMCLYNNCKLMMQEVNFQNNMLQQLITEIEGIYFRTSENRRTCLQNEEYVFIHKKNN
jgi:hypothetical protein